MAVEFTDNSMIVEAELDDAMIAFLYEAAGELEAQVKRNQRVGNTGQTKNQWTYVVDEEEGIAVVGNPLENAIWEEFGTGQYALNGDGRKGWWVYVDDGGHPKSYTSSNQKIYTYQEALEIYGFLKSQGLDAHITRGKMPHRAFHRAFTSLKPALIKRAQEVLKARFRE